MNVTRILSVMKGEEGDKKMKLQRHTWIDCTILLCGEGHWIFIHKEMRST